MMSLRTCMFFLLSTTTMSYAIPLSQPNFPQKEDPKPHPKYRNIIFDMGAVLVDWNPKKVIETLFHNRFSSKTELPYELVQATESHLWKEYDRGTISDEKLISLISKTYNIPHGDAALFVYYAPKSLDILPSGLKIFENAKKLGFKIYLLTNLSHTCFTELCRTTPFFAEANGYLASFEINTIKPEPEIYQALLKKYNLLPEECLFIDDRSDNIKAGEALGIDGIVCDNHPNAIEALKNKGIIIQ